MTAKPRKRGTQAQQKKAFLAAYAELGTIVHACRAANVPRRTVYNWRQADEDFALALHDAGQDVRDDLVKEAIRRAKDGSDTMLIFMLKALDPAMFRENVKVEHSGRIAHDLEGLSDEQLDKVAQGLEALP